MSFPTSFGTQVGAIMDVLAKAAVAEITKLVEDGTVVLRLEMCRREGEIRELKRSLKQMEVELCKAQEAGKSRATEDKQEQTTDWNMGQGKDEKGDQETYTEYLVPKITDSTCEPQHETEQSCDIIPAVKHEPADESASNDTTNNVATAAVCIDQVEQMWPPLACGIFEKNSVAMQDHSQMFSPHTDQYAPHRITTEADALADDSLNLQIKEEIESRPVCMGTTAAECAQNEPFRHVSHPVVTLKHCLQPASQHAGPSLEPPHAQMQMENRSEPSTENYNISRTSLRAKRIMNVWRANQRQFICSVCNRGFPRLSMLEDHKATHQPFKPYRCLECGKSFTQKTRLKTHQSVHTGERPYSCKICGKMFSRQDNCLRHERFHSGLRPYSCGQCGKSFTVLGNLKIHQEIHLKGR